MEIRPVCAPLVLARQRMHLFIHGGRATVHRHTRPQQVMAFARIQVRPIHQQHRAGARPNEWPTQALIVLDPLSMKGTDQGI